MNIDQRISKLESAAPAPAEAEDVRLISEASMESLDYDGFMRMLCGQPDAEADAVMLLDEDPGPSLKDAMAEAGVVMSVRQDGESQDAAGRRISDEELRVYGEWSGARERRYLARRAGRVAAGVTPNDPLMLALARRLWLRKTVEGKSVPAPNLPADAPASPNPNDAADRRQAADAPRPPAPAPEAPPPPAPPPAVAPVPPPPASHPAGESGGTFFPHGQARPSAAPPKRRNFGYLAAPVRPDL